MKTFKYLGGPFHGDETRSLFNPFINLYEHIGYSLEGRKTHKRHKYIRCENIIYDRVFYSWAYVHEDVLDDNTVYRQADIKPGKIESNISDCDKMVMEETRQYIIDGLLAKNPLFDHFINGDKKMSNMPHIKVNPTREKKFLPYEIVIKVNTEEEHEFMKNALHFWNQFWAGRLREILQEKIEERD